VRIDLPRLAGLIYDIYIYISIYNDSYSSDFFIIKHVPNKLSVLHMSYE